MFLMLLLLVVTWSVISDADGAERGEPIRIGALTDSWGPTTGVVCLRDALRELGYRENVDFVLGVRFTQGDVTALPAAARDLVQQGADLLFTSNPISAKAAQLATQQTPIVFTGAGDPVVLGLIGSFALPGGNITGVTELDLELAPKRLEVLQELVPGLRRVLFPYDPIDSFSVAELRAYRNAAEGFRIQLVEKILHTENEAKLAIDQISKNDVHGIIAPRSLASNIPGLILEATSQKKIAQLFPDRWYPENGGLASYSSNLYESGRRAARLVDKILKGSDPGRIPVEVNTEVEFVLNFKVAQALGLRIPPQVLYQVDRFIK
jgi:putative tryptophan/tyrosine transport system substrate-binding protein